MGWPRWNTRRRHFISGKTNPNPTQSKEYSRDLITCSTHQLTRLEITFECVGWMLPSLRVGPPFIGAAMAQPACQSWDMVKDVQVAIGSTVLRTVRPMSKLMTSDVTGSLWSGDKDHTQVATIIRRKGKFKISILGLSLREH